MPHIDDAAHRALNSGDLYLETTAELLYLEEERQRGKELADAYNATAAGDGDGRRELLEQLFEGVGDGVWIEPPLHVAYGCHTRIGHSVYANFNLVIVDDADVVIGDEVMFAPNVTLATAGHPIDPALRATGQQFSSPIVIEERVWIGANTVVMPGVRIGAGSVIGSGSVVTRHIPAGVVAAGSPARVLRRITEADRTFVPREPATAEIPGE